MKNSLFIKLCRRFSITLSLLSIALLLSSCVLKTDDVQRLKVRHLIDTIGFTQYNRQFDSVLSRIAPEDKRPFNRIFKAAICPHDDYAYTAGLYARTLLGIKAKTIILIGVAHKARKFNLENKLIFGDFDLWKCNDEMIPVSPLRDELLKKLSGEVFRVHDSMMQLEHSLEAINPFLQRNIEHLEIIPLLVPYMTFENMEKFSDQLARSMYQIMKTKGLKYGKDLAVVISNDAIHYGNIGWGGSDLAPFGVDSVGNARAKAKDLKIIDECLTGEMNSEKIKRFYDYTVDPDDFKAYQWTWCGRYSVPFGLLFANKLNRLNGNQSLKGVFVGYRSSYPTTHHIEVTDLGMGTTAPANNSHWVSYVGMLYR